MKKYKLGLLDPAWLYNDQQQNDPARGGITYPTLSMDEMAKIPLYKAFDNDSILVTWVTSPKLVDSFYTNKEGNHHPLSVINAWGFRPVTLLFVWVKTNKNGAVVNDTTDLMDYDDYYSGLGRYTNSNVEMAIVARRGKGLPRIEKNVKQLIIAPIRGHSEKPQEQYNRLMRLYGDVPRVEFFARQQNPPPVGWDATGFDYDGRDIREWINDYA